MVRSFARGAALAATTLMIAVVLLRPSAAQPAGASVVVTGVRLIDGTGRPPLENASLVITNGRVEAVGARLKAPAGATVVDLAGKTVVPGLINAHGHLGNGDKKLPLHDQILQQLRMYARYGVTTVQTMGDDGVESVKIRDGQEGSALDRARLYPAGSPVVGESVEDARQKVDKVASMHVSMIKTRMNHLTFADGSRTGSPVSFRNPDMTPEVYRAVIEQAHAHGIRVAAHLFYLEQAKGLVNAGLDVIGHSIRDQDVDSAFIAELKRRNVGYIATLTRDLAVFEFETEPSYFNDPFFVRGMSVYQTDLDEIRKPAFQEKVRSSEEAQLTKKALQQGSRNVKLLSDGGVAIALGTDTGAAIGRWQGFNEHRELELMVKAGISPMQALVSATGGAARVLKLDQQLGTLQPGKWADFVVLGANPLTDIRNTRQIESVWMAGRRLDVTK
jgi:imidazolonepropionase-like amidohydrolase